MLHDAITVVKGADLSIAVPAGTLLRKDLRKPEGALQIPPLRFGMTRGEGWLQVGVVTGSEETAGRFQPMEELSIICGAASTRRQSTNGRIPRSFVAASAASSAARAGAPKAGTPRSQKRDLGHPLKILSGSSPCFALIFPYGRSDTV